MSFSSKHLISSLLAKVRIHPAEVIVCPDMATADQVKLSIDNSDADRERLTFVSAVGLIVVVTADTTIDGGTDAGELPND